MNTLNFFFLVELHISKVFNWQAVRKIFIHINGKFVIWYLAPCFSDSVTAVGVLACINFGWPWMWCQLLFEGYGFQSHLASTPVAKSCPQSSLRSRRFRLQIAEFQAWLWKKPSIVQHPPPIPAHLPPHLRAPDTQVPLLSQQRSPNTVEHLLCVRPQTFFFF